MYFALRKDFLMDKKVEFVFNFLNILHQFEGYLKKKTFKIQQEIPASCA